MEQYLIYLAPPLLGAFIGYMTNYVAIRMLFRPLKEWRFLGIRVPMTPGVIPSKRHDLAENIGTMVGDHLLTSADISKSLTHEGFRNELESVVVGRVSTVLQRDLGPISTVIPKRFQSSFAAGVKVLRGRTLIFIRNHIDSEQFANSIADIIIVHIEDFLTNDLAGLIPDAKLDHFFDVLDETVSKLLAKPETSQWINSYIDGKLDKILTEGKCIEDLLPEELLKLVSAKIEQEIPSLLGKAADIIMEPAMQDRIVKGICKAIEEFIAALGPMAALVSGFLNPELIDQKVREYLHNKGDDIADWMSDETVQEKVSLILHDKLKEYSSTPIVTLIKTIDQDKIIATKVKISQQLTSLIQNPSVATTITSIVKESLQTQVNRPLRNILVDLFSDNGVDRGEKWTAEEIINIIRSEKFKHVLNIVAAELVEKSIMKRPIGPLADLLPQRIQDGFCDYLMQVTTKLLISEVPNLVDSLNIKDIVTKKVDSLDLLRLEDLLMGIMQEQFKYINLFGGLLGFIIGLCNLIFLL